MATKIIYHCDYCGIKVDPENIKKIKTPWSLTKTIYGMLINDWYERKIEGEACIKCYESYKRWAKSRRIK